MSSSLPINGPTMGIALTTAYMYPMSLPACSRSKRSRTIAVAITRPDAEATPCRILSSASAVIVVAKADAIEAAI